MNHVSFVSFDFLYLVLELWSCFRSYLASVHQNLPFTHITYCVCQAHLNLLQKSVDPTKVFFRQQILCRTLAGNSCPLVTITACPASRGWKDLHQLREYHWYSGCQSVTFYSHLFHPISGLSCHHVCVHTMVTKMFSMWLCSAVIQQTNSPLCLNKIFLGISISTASCSWSFTQLLCPGSAGEQKLKHGIM